MGYGYCDWLILVAGGGHWPETNTHTGEQLIYPIYNQEHASITYLVAIIKYVTPNEMTVFETLGLPRPAPFTENVRWGNFSKFSFLVFFFLVFLSQFDFNFFSKG